MNTLRPPPRTEGQSLAKTAADYRIYNDQLEASLRGDEIRGLLPESVELREVVARLREHFGGRDADG